MAGNTAYPSSFLGQSRHSSSGLAVVIGLHGLALAVAFLMKSGVITTDTIGGAIETYEVPVELPSEEVVQPPEAQPERPSPPLTQTVIPVPPDRVTFIDQPIIDPFPPLPPTPPIAETTPEPVLVAARIHPSHRGALQPRYPGILLRQELEGSCTIRVRIAPNGRVTAAEPVHATHPAFCEATRRQALSRWRFQPATRDGVAVDSWQQHIVEFRIT
jgi:protein TonB